MFIFLALNAISAEYKPVQDQTWAECHKSNITVDYNGDKLPLSYEFCTVDSKITPTFIENEIGKATNHIFQFANEIGVTGKECAKNSNLEIYHVDIVKLNSVEFPGYQKHPGTTLYGIYDPRVSEGVVSSILITNHYPSMNKVVFSHELSHYWFDRLCWNKTWTKDSESFSIKFESFFKKQEDIK